MKDHYLNSGLCFLQLISFVIPINKGKGDCPYWTKVIENGEKLCILRVLFFSR